MLLIHYNSGQIACELHRAQCHAHEGSNRSTGLQKDADNTTPMNLKYGTWD